MPPFVAVPGHPYALYRTYRDAQQRFWIECACNKCGPPAHWQKLCNRPALWQDSVFRYAALHGHGLIPRQR